MQWLLRHPEPGDDVAVEDVGGAAVAVAADVAAAAAVADLVDVADLHMGFEQREFSHQWISQSALHKERYQHDCQDCQCCLTSLIP